MAVFYPKISTKDSSLEEPWDILKLITDEIDSILHVATKFKQEKFAEMLIDMNKSLVDLKNKEEDTPLHIAARVGCSGITKLLIDHSKSSILEMVNMYKDTTLHDAVRNGHQSVVELLLSQKPGLAMMMNEAGESPLYLAVDRKHYDIADYILQNAPEFPYGGRDGMNVLHVATIRMATKFLQKAIEKWPCLASEADDLGWTPLHYASYIDNVGAVELLLKADRSAAYKKDKEGMSALHISAEQGHFNVTKKLISELPSTCELLDNKGRTPLHLAVENGKSIKAVKFMLRSLPVDLINKRDSSGNTPMHLATIHVSPQMALELARDKRVDRGAINKEGLTPIDIIRSRIKLKWFEKMTVIRKLEARGFLPSLRGVVAGRTTEVQTLGTGEPRTQSNDQIAKQEGNGLSTNGETRLKSLYSYAKDNARVGLVVATFVATVTFAAIFTVPYKKAGTTSIQKLAFRIFVTSNSLAFVFSATSMIIHLEAFRRKKVPVVFGGMIYFSQILIPFAIYGMVVAYGSSLYAVVAHEYPMLASVATGIACLFLVGHAYGITILSGYIGYFLVY
ncbi:ankyrin repeat-containing protein At5g02620-like [Juglans microcarpa x Juglans regia]|uniref:ankyrin repeat-containing protein At5g02620-like n=1 Tax=Juglans microcarpa x Juglans regia TaxID=2249226 RepID=UPI001B7F143D|nr:ankyrin repeat-containing protein At5g02620-like [Juglans microcarpa x Juglans regia]